MRPQLEQQQSTYPSSSPLPSIQAHLQTFMGVLVRRVKSDWSLPSYDIFRYLTNAAILAWTFYYPTTTLPAEIHVPWSPMVPPNLFILLIDSTFVGPDTYLPTSCPQSSPPTSISANILVYQWSLNSALWCWHYGPLLWKLSTIVPSRVLVINTAGK